MLNLIKVSSKGYSPSRNLIARTITILLLFSVSLVLATSSLSFNIGPHYLTYAQEESFLEICENLVDDDGDGFADAEDPEGCSPNEGGEVVPDQTTPTQDVITYPDGTTCDPNTQSCPPPEDTGASTPPAEDEPGMMTCPDGRYRVLHVHQLRKHQLRKHQLRKHLHLIASAHQVVARLVLLAVMVSQTEELLAMQMDRVERAYLKLM